LRWFIRTAQWSPVDDGGDVVERDDVGSGTGALGAFIVVVGE
jgi:hypothetical protein